MIVISDATPLNVLVRMNLAETLPALSGRILIPPAVQAELTRDATPDQVRRWMAAPPNWLVVQAPRQAGHGPDKGRGERDAVQLAKELGADRVLADDGKARGAAKAPDYG